MNRIRRNTLVLMVVIVLLLVFPSIGDTVRGTVAYLVGETGSRILGALASIATILTLLYVILEPQIRQSNQGSPGHTPESPTARTGDGHSQSRQETTGAQTTHPDNDARRRIRDEAQDVAREVN